MESDVGPLWMANAPQGEAGYKSVSHLSVLVNRHRTGACTQFPYNFTVDSINLMLIFFKDQTDVLECFHFTDSDRSHRYSWHYCQALSKEHSFIMDLWMGLSYILAQTGLHSFQVWKSTYRDLLELDKSLHWIMQPHCKMCSAFIRSIYSMCWQEAWRVH